MCTIVLSDSTRNHQSHTVTKHHTVNLSSCIHYPSLYAYIHTRSGPGGVPGRGVPGGLGVRLAERGGGVPGAGRCWAGEEQTETSRTSHANSGPGGKTGQQHEGCSREEGKKTSGFCSVYMIGLTRFIWILWLNKSISVVFCVKLSIFLFFYFHGAKPHRICVIILMNLCRLCLCDAVGWSHEYQSPVTGAESALVFSRYRYLLLIHTVTVCD